MIDETDAKLISLLEQNGRLRYSELAITLKLNPITVSKRVEALLRNNVITINAVPNMKLMGYNVRAIICMNVALEEMDAVCGLLKHYFNVNLIVSTFGRFNLLVVAYFLNWDLLHEFVATHLSGRPGISEIELYFIDETIKRYDWIQPGMLEATGAGDIDTTDHRIIEELCRDGRATARYLSGILGISLSSVSKRLNRLLDRNIIRIKAIINPSQIGYQADAYIFLRADRACIDQICSDLTQDQEVITIMTLNNGYDVFLALISKDSEALFNLLRAKIVCLPGITMMDILIKGVIIRRYYGDINSKA